VTECLEVEHFIDASRVLDVHEELHSEHCVDEHDEEEQETDVEQRRKRHGQRKQQRSDAFRRLDEAKDACHSKYSNDTKQRRIRRIERCLLSQLVGCNS